MQCRPRLADASRADERDQLIRFDQTGDLFQLGLTADERVRHSREVIGECIERAQRGKLADEAGRHQLVDALGPVEVAQFVLAEVEEARFSRQIVV